MIHVGKLVRTTAKNCGVTMKELARRLGVSLSTVENYVTRGSLDVEVLQRISTALDVNLIDVFLSEDDNPGFTVVTKELREARAEVYKVQRELDELACENYLLKEEISKLRASFNRSSEQSLISEFGTTNSSRAQTFYR